MRWRALLLLPILLPGGCASSSPDLYSLDMRPGPVRAGIRRVVVVRGVVLPRYLDREEVVRAVGGARLRVAENDWWGEPLRAMLRRILVADLMQRLPAANVLVDEGILSTRPDVEIEVEVQRFDRSPGGPMVFEGYAAVIRPGRLRILNRLRLEVPVDADTTKTQVGAMSIAWGQVADAIAPQLLQ